jgi:hypothetical protein
MTEEDAKAYLELGITANEVVKLRWPDMEEERCAHMLWEHTPFPLQDGLLDLVEAVAAIPEGECDGTFHKDLT